MIINFILGFFRHWRDAFKSFFRNFTLSISSLASINVTLVVVSISILLGLNFNQVSKSIEQEVTVIGFFDIAVTAEEQEQFLEDLESLDYIKSIDYRDRDEELATLSESSKNISAITSNYEEGENPLRDAVYIQTNDITKNSDLADYLQASGLFSTIKANEDITSSLIDIFSMARYLMIFIVLALILVTVFIISNTIRITIFSRRDKIDIMRLVGASNYHITMPYIYEGIFIGLFGSIGPILLTVFGYEYVYEKFGNLAIETSSFFTLLEPGLFIYQISAVLLGIGVIVGMIGSAFSVRRYLRR